jgi:hypothetical protein
VIKRLGLVLLAVGWSPFALMTVWNKDAPVQVFVIALPWLVWLALVGVGRYVVNGNLRPVWRGVSIGFAPPRRWR